MAEGDHQSQTAATSLSRSGTWNAPQLGIVQACVEKDFYIPI